MNPNPLTNAPMHYQLGHRAADLSELNDSDIFFDANACPPQWPLINQIAFGPYHSLDKYWRPRNTKSDLGDNVIKLLSVVAQKTKTSPVNKLGSQCL